MKEESLLAKKFYTTYHEPLFWFSSGKKVRRATKWLNSIESAGNLGYFSNKLQTDQIRATLSGKIGNDDISKEAADKQITGMVLNFIKFLKQGNVSFEYDEISVPRDSVYISQLINMRYWWWRPVSKIVTRLDCKDKEYVILKKFLHDSITMQDSFKYKTILLAMNYRRYLAINHQPEYVLVNIPTAEAEYYRNNKLDIKMRTVPGRKKNPTPTIASYITSIVTFPYWNVPRDIAVKEILPKVQKKENYLEQNNFEVVDSKGYVIEDSALIWNDFTEKNFPYYFRQATGLDNSLGVLKFNLRNPFSIFLHATSYQGAFAKNYRFLSHGCIRLEKPFELANALLRGSLDKEELNSGKKNTESKTIMLPNKIPVFIIYVPVTLIGKKVIFLDDVYGLIK